MVTINYEKERGKVFMIYTLTLNPSLDYIMTLDDLQIGKTNRSVSELIYP